MKWFNKTSCNLVIRWFESNRCLHLSKIPIMTKFVYNVLYRKGDIMICGIYKITNKINGHSYIGQSVDIKRR